MTLDMLPGYEWHDNAVKPCNYLVMDAGEKPGRGSVADSSRVFSRPAAPPTVILPGLLRMDKYENYPANYRLQY